MGFQILHISHTTLTIWYVENRNKKGNMVIQLTDSKALNFFFRLHIKLLSNLIGKI